MSRSGALPPVPPTPVPPPPVEEPDQLRVFLRVFFGLAGLLASVAVLYIGGVAACRAANLSDAYAIAFPCAVICLGGYAATGRSP